MPTPTISLDEVMGALPKRRRARVERAADRMIAELELDEELVDLKRRLDALDKPVTVLVRDQSGRTVDLAEPDALDKLRALLSLEKAPQPG